MRGIGSVGRCKNLKNNDLGCFSPFLIQYFVFILSYDPTHSHVG